MILPSWFKTGVKGLFALVALVAFVVLTWRTLRDVMDADAEKTPTYSDWVTYLATALSALVGGVVAVAFGQAAPPLPPAPPADGGPPPAGGGAEVSPSASAVAVASLSNLARTVSFGSVGQIGLGILYVLIYLIAGVVSCVIWAANPDEVSTVVKNLAVTFVGLFFPIAQGFFSTPAEPSE